MYQAEENNIKSESLVEKHDDLTIDNLPNRLTILRILLIPVVVGALMLANSEFQFLVGYSSFLSWTAAIIFALASITDFLDGYIARKRKIVTVFGTFVDPIADKFLVVSSLIVLGSLNKISIVVVIILVVREMYMTSLRLLALTEGLKVPVNKLGKWKTATQMVGIPLIMTGDDQYFIPLTLIGAISIYISTFLSVYSAFQYSIGLIKKMKIIRKRKKLLKASSRTPH